MNIAFSREVGHIRYVARRLLWRLCPPGWMTLPTGVRFFTPRDSVFASDVFVTRCNVDWNSEYILAAYLSRAGSDGDFLDVGAHIGYYSCLVSPYVRKVVAFEPDPRNQAHLARALEGLASAEFVPKAVSDVEGEILFSEGCGSSVSHIATSPEGEGLLRVPVTTIDSAVESMVLAPVAIKMDIEGFEILALEGARSVAATFGPVFLVEYGIESDRPNSLEGLQEFLESASYALFAVSRNIADRGGYRYSFDELTPLELADLSTKMLFLVPEDKRGWFSDLGAQIGSWTGKALRPAGVRRFLQAYGG